MYNINRVRTLKTAFRTTMHVILVCNFKKVLSANHCTNGIIICNTLLIAEVTDVVKINSQVPRMACINSYL